jgi:hypothetical protein
MLTQIGSGIAQQAGVPLRTEDLAPPSAEDPRGAGLAASALPITLAGLLPAVALVLLLKREVWTRFAAAAAFAAIAGTTIAALLRYVFGSINQNVWGVAAGLTLGLLAAGLSMLGLGSLFGRVGLAVGTLLTLLLGNPLSGLNSARRCCRAPGAPSVSGYRRAPLRRFCDQPPSLTVPVRRPRLRC